MSLPPLPPALRGIQLAVQQGSVAHAYILQGMEGCGKKAYARGLAKALICTAKDNQPCGACAGCRRATSGTHPDVLELAPDEKGRIGIDVVRGLLAELDKRPMLGGWRVVLLLDAHAMSDGAQNALLKTLEQPPASTVFLLTAHPGAMLPTVLSRCIPVSLGGLPTRQAAAYVSKTAKLPPEEADRYVRCAGGLAQAAVHLASAQQEELGAVATRVALAALGGDSLAAYPLFGDRKEHTAQLLFHLRCFYLDVLRLGSGAPPLYAKDGQAVADAAKRLPPAAVLGVLAALQQAERRLQAGVNINHQLAVEAMLLSIAKEAISCQQ